MSPGPGQGGPSCRESCVITYRAQCEAAYTAWLASDRGAAASAQYVSDLTTALNNLTTCLDLCPES